MRGFATSETTGKLLTLVFPTQTSKCNDLDPLSRPRLNTDVSPGDVVQVNAQFDEARGCYVIDNTSPASVIVNPDQLISGTTVATGVTCARRYVDMWRCMVARAYCGVSEEG